MDEQPTDEGIPPTMCHQIVGLLLSKSVDQLLVGRVVVTIECSLYVHFYHCSLQSEKDGFAIFHIYVCAALMAHFSRQIRAKKDFQVH